MGNFRFVLNAVGGHGCDRVAKEGEALVLPRNKPDDVSDEQHRAYCPDCRIKAFVESMSASFSVNEATLWHWPVEGAEVVDDVKNGVRLKGQF